MADESIKPSIQLIEKETYIHNKQQESKFKVSSEGSTNDKTKKDYHAQRLSQSKWAFRLSFWGGIVGFGTIIWSIWYGTITGNVQWIGIVSGAVLDAVSVLFYRMSNKVNERISEFFVELTRDENIRKSIYLAESIENKHSRDELKVKLSLHLAGMNEERICKNTIDVCEEKSYDT